MAVYGRNQRVQTRRGHDAFLIIPPKKQGCFLWYLNLNKEGGERGEVYFHPGVISASRGRRVSECSEWRQYAVLVRRRIFFVEVRRKFQFCYSCKCPLLMKVTLKLFCNLKLLVKNALWNTSFKWHKYFFQTLNLLCFIQANIQVKVTPLNGVCVSRGCFPDRQHVPSRGWHLPSNFGFHSGFQFILRLSPREVPKIDVFIEQIPFSVGGCRLQLWLDETFPA